MKTLGLAVLGAAALLFSPAAAQEIKAEKRDADYYWVTMVNFKSGREDAARAIIKDYFNKASENAGVSPLPMDIHMMTGEYDLMIIWKQHGGLAGMEWKISPDNVKWMAALADLTGGQEEAIAKWQEYVSHIATSESNIGWVAKD